MHTASIFFIKRRTLLLTVLAIISLVTWLSVLGAAKDRVEAAPDLTIEPLTWNVIGLDSNNPATGPKNFPVGARVCSPTGTAGNPVVVNFVWDDPADTAYINLRPSSLSQLTLSSGLTPGQCFDAYFEAEVTPNASSFDQARSYHITATSGADSVSTTQPRELYVEYLISQNRNSTTNIRYGTTLSNLVSVAPGGSMNLLVGGTYIIELTGGTATQGYEQFEEFITLTNWIFQINSVSTDYAANNSPYVSDPSDKLYADACSWQNDPASPVYRECLDSGYKTGGAPVVVTYNVTIIAGGGTTQTLNSLLYDFSGSSYHYNSDFSLSARFANIIDPASADISKRFVPSTISVGGVSTLIITLTNPNAGALSGYRFDDNLPSGVKVAAPPSASTSGCGTPTFAPNANDTTLSFTNGTVAGNSTCTISVNVTSSSQTTHTNTTTHLFIGSVDTGNSATADLTVTNVPPPPTCTGGLPLATWNFDVAGITATNPVPSSATVTANATAGAGLTPVINTTDNISGTANSWESDRIDKTGSLNTGLDQYFEFAVDTTGLTEVELQFYAQRTPQGPQSIQLYYGTSAAPPGSSFGSPYTLSDTSWTAFGPANITSGLNSSGMTYFRLYVYNAGNDTNGHAVRLDGVTFTGCGIPDAPTIIKNFAPDPIAAGGTSTLTFTLTNPNATIALTGVGFSDTLPTDVTVASPTGASSNCGGTWAPINPGDATITFSGGTIPIGGSCTVQVNVIASAVASSGPRTNISGFVSTTQTGTNDGSGGSATDTLTIVSPPQISKQFLPNPILANGVSTLTFIIVNPNQNNNISGVAFSDTFPTSPGAMVVANPTGATSTCGGTWAPAIGAGSVSLTGGSITAGGSCTLTVNVTAPTTGTYNNLSGFVSHTVNGSPVNGNQAVDTLTVNPPNPAIAILKQVSSSPSGPWFSYLAIAETADVYYRITIENVGDVPLSPLSVSDPDLDPLGCSWTDPLPVASALDDNHIDTCVIGPVPAAAGEHINTATASGFYGLTQAPPSEDSATYGTTGLTSVKTANTTVYTTAGDIIDYTFTVTNTGSATLNGPVTVTDDHIASVTCPALSTIGNGNNFFEPAEQIVCTGSYTITALDVSNGSVTNIAHANAGGAQSLDANATVTLPENPVIGAAKAMSATGSGPYAVTIDYTFENFGNVVLSKF